MKKRIGKIAAIVLALALMLSLAACGTGGTASESKAVSAGSAATTTTGEKVTLKFLHKWPQPEYQVYFDDIVAAYMKENPNVTIVSEGVADEPQGSSCDRDLYPAVHAHRLVPRRNARLRLHQCGVLLHSRRRIARCHSDAVQRRRLWVSQRLRMAAVGDGAAQLFLADPDRNDDMAGSEPAPV